MRGRTGLPNGKGVAIQLDPWLPYLGPQPKFPSAALGVDFFQFFFEKNVERQNFKSNDRDLSFLRRNKSK